MELSDIKLMEQLFYKYYKVLRAYAFRFVSDPNAAEDIVQDVFMGIWENRANMEDSPRIKSYLFKSVYNRSINYLSSKKVSNEESLERMIDQINLSAKSDYNQENLFMANELRRAVKEFVGNLSPHAGMIFEMSRVKNMKVKEIAEAMNLSPKTIEKYLYKSLIDLKQYLHENGMLGALLLLYFQQKNLL